MLLAVLLESTIIYSDPSMPLSNVPYQPNNFAVIVLQDIWKLICARAHIEKQKSNLRVG